MGGSYATPRGGERRRAPAGWRVPARRRLLVVLLLVEIAALVLYVGWRLREAVAGGVGSVMPAADGWGRFWLTGLPVGPGWLADLAAAGVMFLLVRKWSIGMDRAPADEPGWGRVWRWVLTDRAGALAQADGRRPDERAYPFQGCGRALVAAALVWLNFGMAIAGRADPVGNWVAPLAILAVWAGLGERWFLCGALAAGVSAIDRAGVWVAPFFVLWPLCANAPRAATRVVAGWAVITALVASPYLVRSGLALMWVTGVALIPVLLKKDWWGRVREQASRGGASVANVPKALPRLVPFASVWVAVPVAIELVLWPGVMESGRSVGALCAMAGVALGVVAMCRRMGAGWTKVQVGMAAAAALLVCPLIFGGSYAWAAEGGLAAGRVGIEPILQSGWGLGADRVAFVVDLPGLMNRAVTVGEVMVVGFGAIVLLAGFGAARGDRRGSPGLLAAACVPWLAGAALLGGGERWVVVAGCLSAAWVAVGVEMAVVGLAITGVGWMALAGGGAWVEVTRGAWGWVVVVGAMAALSGGLWGRRGRAG